MEKIKLEVFAQDTRGKRESLGKYETEIENYTLCIDMRGRCKNLANILFVHLEFFGKILET